MNTLLPLRLTDAAWRLQQLAILLLLISVSCWHNGIEYARIAGVISGLPLLFLCREKHGDPRAFLLAPAVLLLLAFGLTAGVSLVANGHDLSPLMRIVNWLMTLLMGYWAVRVWPDHHDMKRTIPTQGNGFDLADVLLLAPLAGVATFLVVLTAVKMGWLPDTFGSDYRLWLRTAHPNLLGMVFGMLALIALGRVLLPGSGWIRGFAAALLIPLLAALLWSGSRGAVFALLATMPVLTLILIRNRRIRILLAGSIVALAAALILIGPLFSPKLERLRSVLIHPTEDANYLSRQVIWHVSWKMFAENPLTGVGFARFQTAYDDDLATNRAEYEQRFRYVEPTAFNAHNFFLHLLAETGLLGCLTLGGLWAWAIAVGFTRGGSAATVGSALLFLLLTLQLSMGLYNREVSSLAFFLAGTLIRERAP